MRRRLRGGSLVGVGSVNALTRNGVSVANVTVQAQINALPPSVNGTLLGTAHDALLTQPGTVGTRAARGADSAASRRREACEEV